MSAAPSNDSKKSSSYIPYHKRSGDTWSKSVKHEHKTISITSMDDFPALQKPAGGAGIVVVPDVVAKPVKKSLTLAEKLRKKIDEEEAEEERVMILEKEEIEKTNYSSVDHESIKAIALHRKLFRTYPANFVPNEAYAHDEEAILYDDEYVPKVERTRESEENIEELHDH
jgi:hypothetical protein